MTDISILVPSVRIEKLERVYETISKNIGKYSFEMVVVSPFADLVCRSWEAPKNVKLIRDFGSPNRAMQIAGYMAEGNLVMNCADDATFYGSGLQIALNQYYDNEATRYDYVIAVQYTEDFRPRMDGYWLTQTHDDLRLPTIPNMVFSAVHLCKREFWDRIGGYYCGYDNPNFSTIEFMLRAQRQNAKIELSEEPVYDVHWTQGDSEVVRRPVHFSTLEHDIPLFKKRAESGELYTLPKVEDWKNSPSVWKRRFPD